MGTVPLASCFADRPYFENPVKSEEVENEDDFHFPLSILTRGGEFDRMVLFQGKEKDDEQSLYWGITCIGSLGECG